MNSAKSISRLRRVATLTLAGLAVAGLASAALWADNVPTSVLLGGGFEATAVSLRLPEVERFPLVAGGWGARAAAAGAIRSTAAAFEGDHALEIEASAQAPAHVLQDVPLGERSFRLAFAVERLRGRQALMLVDEWDRRLDAAPRPSLRVEMTAAGLSVTTRQGTWNIDRRMAPGRWFEIVVEADARARQTLVRIDGAVVGILPGVPDRAPRTVILGGDRGREGSLFRYDAISMLRLSEVELATIEDRVLREAPAELPEVMARLDVAAQAIEMGAGYLALPELRAAGRLLDASPGTADTSDALAALIALIEAR